MTVTPQASSGPTTPEEFRQRYLELQRAAREKGRRRPALEGSGNPAVLAAEAIVVDRLLFDRALADQAKAAFRADLINRGCRVMIAAMPPKIA